MNKITNYIVLLAYMVACSPDQEEPNGSDSVNSPIYGTVQLNFPIDDSNLPKRCIKRADLSIAYTAESLYRKEFLTVSNVSDYQSLYEFSLKPGSYYYQAGKTCICGGDTCLWGGYPNGQNGMKWTMGKFEIFRGDITVDQINFSQ